VYATVTLSNDSAGAIGTAVATSAGSTQNGVTAIVGQPQIAAAGAALAIGGAFTAVHRIFLFGPGGWVRADGGTGVTSMAWDGSVMQNGMSGNGGANTYPVGPVSSSGAFRVDFPPAGTPNMTVKSWVGGVSPVGTTAMPVSAISDVLYLSIWAKSFGLSATATIVLQLLEYNPSGVLQRTDTIATLTGNQPNWVALSGSVTTGTACAYAAINVVISDTGAGSANGTVWLDNCLCWDATVTSALTMPYQELRFPQSPGMLITSGLLGDMPATAIVQMGTYVASLATGHTMFAYLGRRAISTSSMRLVNPSTGGSCTIDNAAYGGYHLAANPGVFYGSTDNESGVYHFLARAQSSNAAPSNNVFIQTQVFMIEGGFSVTGAGNATLTPGSSLGPQMFPLTTQNVWTNCDLGQVQLPISPTGAISDPTQVSAYVSTGSGATTGGSGLTVNTVMLLPVDGELFQARIQNSANNSNAVTTQWVYLYWDGVTPTTTYSLEAAPLADAAHAIANPKGTVPIVFLNNVQLVVTSNADTVPQVDPTVDTSLQMGVNQYLLHVTDDAATVMPVACDIVYSPLYLYPR
jgi:hypothetical protein